MSCSVTSVLIGVRAIQAAGLAYLVRGHQLSDDQLGAFLDEALGQAGWLPHSKT